MFSYYVLGLSDSINVCFGGCFSQIPFNPPMFSLISSQCDKRAELHVQPVVVFSCVYVIHRVSSPQSPYATYLGSDKSRKLGGKLPAGHCLSFQAPHRTDKLFPVSSSVIPWWALGMGLKARETPESWLCLRGAHMTPTHILPQNVGKLKYYSPGPLCAGKNTLSPQSRHASSLFNISKHATK